MDGGAFRGPIAACDDACRCVRSWVGTTTSSPAGWRSTWLPITAAAWRDGSSGPWWPSTTASRKPDGYATGWSESLPVITRDGASVLAAIQRLRQQLPFPLRGIDADNDPAFMNALMEQWCDAPDRGSSSPAPAPTRATIRHGWSRRTGC